VSQLSDVRLVVRIDLRRELDDVRSAAALDGRLREAMRDAHLRAADVSRVLVTDTTADLGEHAWAYERLCTHPGVAAVLCLAIGPTPGRVQGRDAGASEDDGSAAEPFHDPYVLVRPAQLQPPQAAVLWTGDVRGIGWHPGQNGAMSLTDSGMAADDVRGLDPLIELLQVPEVFDEAMRSLGEMPEAVASPALRLLVHEVPEDDLLRTQLQALDVCVSPSTDVRAATPPTGALAVLAGLAEPDDLAVDDCLPEDSRLRRTHWEAVEQMRRAQDALSALAGWRGLLSGGPATAAAVDTLRTSGEVLAGYRDSVERLFETVDGRVGLDSDSRDQLTAMGVRIPRVPGTGSEEVGRALREHVLSRLARHQPLPEVVAWLDEFARRTVPSGSGAEVERVHQLCPDSVVDDLLRPPDFRIGRESAWAAVLGGAAALLAVLGVGGLPAAAVVLVLLVAAGVRAAFSGADASEPGAGTQQLPLWLAVPATVWRPRAAWTLLIGWLAGAVIGAGVRFAATPPAWTRYLLTVLAALALVWAALALWSAAVRVWEARSGLATAAEVTDRLGEVIDRSVLKHWLLADARAGASDQARALRSLLDTCRQVLTDFTEQLGRRAHSGWESSAHPGDGGRTGPGGGRSAGVFAVEYVGHAGQTLQDTLVGDLADLVAAALSPYWQEALRNPSAAGALPVASRTNELIHAYQRQLARVGTAPPPSFARDPAARPDPASLVGVDLYRVVQVLSPGSGAETLQLCSPEQLRMLDRTPGATRSFGFVPQAMQGSFLRSLGAAPAAPGAGTARGEGAAADPERRAAGRSVWDSAVSALPEIVWTASGRFAGLLRLVPLSTGAVRVTWRQDVPRSGATAGQASGDGTGGAAAGDQVGEGSGEAG
jgi:hypothetical protein